MKTTALGLALVGLISAFAQRRSFPCQADFQPVRAGLSYDSSHHIYRADTAGLWSLIHRYDAKELVVIVSSSSGCGGTPAAITYLNELVSEGQNVQYLFVLGDNLRSCAGFPAFFSQLDSQIIRVIPSERYASGNFMGGDARKRSNELLKATFPDTKTDIIATPKYYIFRPQTDELLFHGMRSYQNPYPEDVVRYFLKKLKS